MDRRKVTLTALNKLWVVCTFFFAGIALGALIYFAYHAITDRTVYSATSEFYLDFAIDPTGEVYDYYNGYTWNDLMTTDPIAGHTLEYLKASEAGANAQAAGLDISLLEQATTADILSDIRVLHVTIKDGDEALCGAIQSATESALITFGEEAKEFTKISVIKTEPPKRIYADDRLKQALILGAIIGAIAGVFAVWLYVVLDDSVRFPSDLRGMQKGFVSVSFKEQDEALADRFKTGAEPMPEGASVIDAGEFSALNVRLTDTKYSGDHIISVPYGKVTRSALDLLQSRIEADGGRVLGFVIKDADNREYKKYYFLTSR